jgi:hypothetical protein
VRPDNAFLAEQQRLLVGWPTKLALAPDLTDRVLASLSATASARPPDLADLPARHWAYRPGSNCCHEPANPARPSPTGQHRPACFATGPGHGQAGPRPGREIPNGFTIPDDEAARLLLAQARELGINLIDTAPAYGRSEDAWARCCAASATNG